MQNKLSPNRWRLLTGVLAVVDILILIGVILLLLPEGPSSEHQTVVRETLKEGLQPQITEIEDQGKEILIISGEPFASRPQEHMEEEASPAADYILQDSDSKYLTAAELQGLTDWELTLARNEIYARHGRKFKDEKIAEYFSGKSWYTPLYSPEEFDKKGDSVFNTFEIENRKLIQSAEDAR